MLAVLLAAWTMWIWAPGVRHPDNGAWLVDNFSAQEHRPIQIPKEYQNEGHCRSALQARKTQGYLDANSYGECLPSGVHPGPKYVPIR